MNKQNMQHREHKIPSSRFCPWPKKITFASSYKGWKHLIENATQLSAPRPQSQTPTETTLRE